MHSSNALIVIVSDRYMDEKVSLEEYLRLIEKYADELYGSENPDVDYDDIIPDWEEQETYYEAKEKPRFDYDAACDLTTANEDKIRVRLHLVGNIMVGKFLLKANRYTAGAMFDKVAKKEDPGPFLTIAIYEQRKKLHDKVNLAKDVRFQGMPWIVYFKNPIASGKDIPFETVVEIVRWLQGISRLPSFL